MHRVLVAIIEEIKADVSKFDVEKTSGKHRLHKIILKYTSIGPIKTPLQ